MRHNHATQIVWSNGKFTVAQSFQGQIHTKPFLLSSVLIAGRAL
jgi:hypothetical protein